MGTALHVPGQSSRAGTRYSCIKGSSSVPSIATDPGWTWFRDAGLGIRGWGLGIQDVGL